MNRIGFVIKVRQDKIDEYRERHRAVWPDMLDALRRNGWHNYSLFLRPDGLLFGYFETTNTLSQATAAMMLEEVNHRWQESVKHLFEAVGEAHADEVFVELEEVFHLD